MTAQTDSGSYGTSAGLSSAIRISRKSQTLCYPGYPGVDQRVSFPSEEGDGVVNVVIIVFDSLRFDAAQQCAASNLSELSRLYAGAAQGSFTLPAHAALFTGVLPLVDEKFAIDGHRYDRILRSSGARPYDHSVMVEFSGQSIMDAFASHGGTVVGFGGVPYFDPSTPGFSFSRMFPDFYYHGYSSSAPLRDRSWDEAGQICAVRDCYHWISNLTAAEVRKPALIFVNEPGSHFPYAGPGNSIAKPDLPYLKLIETRTAQKKRGSVPGDLLEWGVARQIAALNALDAMVGLLFDAIATKIGRTLVICMSDHGEAFGEDGWLGHGINVDPVLRVPLWAGLIG